MVKRCIFKYSFHDDSNELEYTSVSSCLISASTSKDRAKEDIDIKTQRLGFIENLHRKWERFSELQARGRKKKKVAGDRKDGYQTHLIY